MSVVRIAAQAGVSTATVSRVINRSQRVSPNTAEKVFTAINQLGVLGVAVRGAQKGHNASTARRIARSVKAIAIIALGHDYTTWFQDPVIGNAVAEVSRVAADHGIGIHLAEMPDPTRICSIVEKRKVDGALVLVPSGMSTTAAETLRRYLPVVQLMGAQSGPMVTDQVAPDNLAIGSLAASYLLDQGCRQLAFMTFTPEWSFCKERAMGFFGRTHSAWRAEGVDARSYLVMPPTAAVEYAYGSTPVSRPSWNEVLEAFVAARPTGLFVPRDAELVRIYQMLSDHGVRPGRDITVVSCDNQTSWLSMLQSRPATIELGLAAIAKFAVRRLIARVVRRDEPPIRVLISPNIVPP